MGFLNLIAFGYLSLIPLVLLIYLFNKKKSVVEVPSIIPWESLKEDVLRSRLFRIDSLFILQILLILLLVFFLARPFLKSSIVNISGKNVILVIDSSASMQTSEDRGTRFHQAKLHAIKLVNKLSKWDKMMIISTNYSSRILSDFTDNRGKLKGVINKLNPTDTGTNLDEGVSLGVSFLRNVQRGEMYVLTDQSQSSINMDKQEWENVKFVRYGKNSANVAISSLDVYQDMFKEYTGREAYVTVKNYASEIKDIKLRAFLNDEIIEVKIFRLNSGEHRTLKVDNISTSGILKAEIETKDFFSVDNTAYAIINEIKPIEILLVSDDNKLKRELEKIQDSTHRIKLTRIDTSKFKPDSIKGFDVAVFERFIPDVNPDINSLYIFPLANVSHDQAEGVNEDKSFSKLLFNNTQLVTHARILDWDETHPAMKHLDNLEEINIRTSLEIGLPEWSVPLIQTTGRAGDSTIAYAGTLSGRRIIGLGFGPGEFDYSESENLNILIMTLNLVQWLNPYEMEGQNKVLTGGKYTPNITANGQIEIIPPKGETYKYGGKDNREEHFVFNKIEHVGVYNVSGADVKGRFVANLFDEKESYINPESKDTKVPGFEEKKAVTAVEDKKNEFSKYLLLIVPFLLLVEWFLFYGKLRAGSA